jgi:hypothetical protein
MIRLLTRISSPTPTPTVPWMKGKGTLPDALAAGRLQLPVGAEGPRDFAHNPMYTAVLYDRSRTSAGMTGTRPVVAAAEAEATPHRNSNLLSRKGKPHLLSPVY